MLTITGVNFAIENETNVQLNNTCIMSTPVIIWTAIIGLFIAVIVIRFAVEMVKYFHEDHSHGMPIFQSGSEREEFFVPGDTLEKDDDLLYDED